MLTAVETVKRIKEKKLKSKKSKARGSPRFLIQVTDSVWIGCTAKKSAQRKAILKNPDKFSVLLFKGGLSSSGPAKLETKK